MMTYIYPKLPAGYIAKSTAIILSSGTAFYALLEHFRGNETFHSKQLMPLINYALGPKAAVKFNLWLAKHRLLPLTGSNYLEYPELECTVFGLNFKNPVGLAAGLDKDGVAIKGLSESGFGFIEIGTVTPLPQKNERAGLFILNDDKALISRGKFRSDGLSNTHLRLKRAYADKILKVPLGVNIGQNIGDFGDAGTDYGIGADYFGPYSDYIIINYGGPHGTKELKDFKNALSEVRSSVERLRENKPKRTVLVKVCPDVPPKDLKLIAKMAMDRRHGIDGIVVSNATLMRPTKLISKNKEKEGFVSGEPLKDISNECIRALYRATHGQVPIIGSGGVFTGEDAYEKIRAGATLIQLYSSLIFEGYPVLGKIKRELTDLLIRDGYTHVSQAVGAEHGKI